MQLNTYLADSIEKTEYHSRYDDCAKALTASIPILSRILKHTVKELKDYPLDVIESCIEGLPKITLIADKHMKDTKEDCYESTQKKNARSSCLGSTKEKISGSNTENTIVGEGTVKFDIKFYVILPEAKQRVKIIINLELQKKYREKYHLVTRGILYCARMLSEQKGTEFIDDNYQDIKKVYSIWLCTDVPKKIANTITRYRITREDIYGEIKEEEKYDLMSVILVRISAKEEKKVTNELLKMLRVLFSDEMSAQEKKTQLSSEFGLQMTREIKGGLDEMCNLGMGIMEKGFQKGHREGHRVGRREGRQEGLLEGLQGSLLQFLEHLGDFPELLRERILEETEVEVVKQWFGTAICSKSIEQFMDNACL